MSTKKTIKVRPGVRLSRVQVMISPRDARNAIVSLGAELAEESNAAHDLWSWLPSCRIAKKFHGDYHSEFRPSPRDAMREACDFFSLLKADSLQDWVGDHGMFQCPCGEPEHELDDEKMKVELEALLKEGYLRDAV